MLALIELKTPVNNVLALIGLAQEGSWSFYGAEVERKRDFF
jgi:hypothetical protein